METRNNFLKEESMKRFVQVVIYVQMAFVAVSSIVGFLAHKFHIAAHEQPLARQVGFLLLGVVVTLWVVSRFWQMEPRLLWIPIALSAGGVIHHGFDALIVNTNLKFPAPSGSDIYFPLVADTIFLVLYVVGYWQTRRQSRGSSQTAVPSLSRGVG